jgi:predicted HAD superfamily Cof-like phosphohydrolase
VHEAQGLVEQFHRAVGLTVGVEPALRDRELRASLIREEAAEAVEAIEKGDFIGAIDGLCDLLYVVYGAAVTFGIDVEPFFAEVHRANMTKIGGPVRSDGKRLKPAGWLGPELEPILVQQIHRSSQRRLGPSG